MPHYKRVLRTFNLTNAGAQMALSYVQEDLSRYLDLHDLTGIPFDFQLVMFPYKGYQPPPFPIVTEDPGGGGLVVAPNEAPGQTIITHRMAFPFSELGTTGESGTTEGRERYPDEVREVRWWFHPLIFAGEIPIKRKILKIVKSRPLTINPLCARDPQFDLIKKANPGLVDEFNETRVFSDTIKCWIRLASIERSKVFVSVSSIAREFKKAYPEEFGESGDDAEAEEFRLDDERGERGEKREGKFMKRLKKISPTIARKLTKRNE